MATDPKAEILAQAARLEELIEQSTQIIEKTNALLNQSRRVIRQASVRRWRPKPTKLISTAASQILRNKRTVTKPL